MREEPSPCCGFRTGDWSMKEVDWGKGIGNTVTFCAECLSERTSGGRVEVEPSPSWGFHEADWTVDRAGGVRWMREGDLPRGGFFFPEEARSNPWGTSSGDAPSSGHPKSWSHWGATTGASPFETTEDEEGGGEEGDGDSPFIDTKMTCEDACWEACAGKDGWVDEECLERCVERCDEVHYGSGDGGSGDGDVEKDLDSSTYPFVDTRGLPHDLKPGDLPLSDEDWEFDYDPGGFDPMYGGRSPTAPLTEAEPKWGGTMDKPEIPMDIPVMDDEDCAVSGGPDNCWTPLLDHQNVEDFNSLDVDGLGGNLIVSNLTESIEELVRTSWSLLKRNYDLVEWSLCWYYGEGGAWTVNCLRHHIWADGVDHPFIEVIGKDRCGFKGRFFLYLKSPVIYFPLDAGCIGARYIRAWNNARTDEDRMCVAVDLSATLLHELIHTCGVNMFDKPGDCDATYLIENNFRWAMFQRYSHATEGACCGVGSGVASCFMSHEYTYIGPPGCFS